MAPGDHNDSGDGERDDGIHVEIGLSVSDLLGGILSGSSKNQRRHSEGRPDVTRQLGPSSGDAEPPSTDQSDAATDYHVETYQEDDQVTVFADLPGVDPDDVSAGIAEESNDLVILVDDEIVEWVELPWGVFEVWEATFNNGVLEIRLRAVGEEGG